MIRALTRLIEEELEKDLHELVGDTWNEIEEVCKIERKTRYE